MRQATVDPLPLPALLGPPFSEMVTLQPPHCARFSHTAGVADHTRPSPWQGPMSGDLGRAPRQCGWLIPPHGRLLTATAQPRGSVRDKLCRDGVLVGCSTTLHPVSTMKSGRQNMPEGAKFPVCNARYWISLQLGAPTGGLQPVMPVRHFSPFCGIAILLSAELCRTEDFSVRVREAPASPVCLPRWAAAPPSSGGGSQCQWQKSTGQRGTTPTGAIHPLVNAAAKGQGSRNDRRGHWAASLRQTQVFIPTGGLRSTQLGNL